MTEGLTLTDACRQTIKDCFAYGDTLAAYYGPSHAHTVAAVRSWAHALALALDATSLSPDGPLSLVGRLPGGIVFGVVGHHTRNMCTHTGCSHFVREDQTVGYYSPDVPHGGEHAWARPPGSPDPVTWSTHS